MSYLKCLLGTQFIFARKKNPPKTLKCKWIFAPIKQLKPQQVVGVNFHINNFFLFDYLSP